MTYRCLNRSAAMSDICTEVKLQQLLEQQQQLQQLVEQQIQQNNKHFVKLPELVIPIFDGNKLQWREFWDLFQVTVDKNDQLSEIEKFCYLKSKLTGVAKQSISGIFISIDNYEIAKQVLEDRFSDKEFVLHYNLREVMNLTPAHNNPGSLRLMYDKLESHLRCLEGLKQDINTDVFIVIIKSKLPEDLMRQLELQKGNKTEWSVKTLRESVNKYIHAMETVDHLSYHENTVENTEPLIRPSFYKHRSSQSHTGYQPYILQCRYCDGNHWSDQCTEFFTAEDRKLQIRDSCYVCLKKGHTAFKCRRNKQCVYCGHLNHHHRSLCPKRFPQELYDCGHIGIQQNMSDQNTEVKQKTECEAFRNHNLAEGKETTDCKCIFVEDGAREQPVNLKSEILKLKEVLLDVKEEVLNFRMETKGYRKQTDVISTHEETNDISDKLTETSNVMTTNTLQNENTVTDINNRRNFKCKHMQDSTDGIYKYSRELLLEYRFKK